MTKALITGASSGIGEATAEIFAENGIDLILCGRNEKKLSELKIKLSQYVNVTCLKFNIENKLEVNQALDSIKNELERVDILINNAGCAIGMTTIDQMNLEDMETMIDINIKGTVYVSNQLIPVFIRNKKGTIINVSSIAGKEVYTNGNIYCATKHAIDALTQGMRLDLSPHGIKVASINPGMVETNFSLNRFKGDALKAANIYKGMMPLSADDVADAIYYMCSRPAHVVITDLTIFPISQANATVVKRI
jgi:3-hydroxy acid dehydrogenase/malonic semialdehyde reductase